MGVDIVIEKRQGYNVCHSHAFRVHSNQAVRDFAYQ